MPQGWIAYASSTQGSFHDTTKLYTPYISRTGPQCKLNFYYFMNGPSVDSLHVMVSVNGIQTQLWAMSGSRGMLWHQAQVFIGAKSMAIISIQARRGSSFKGVITVDDVQFIDCQPPIVTPTACLASQFACSNQYCVDMSKQCNYANDCGDGSDEYVSSTCLLNARQNGTWKQKVSIIRKYHNLTMQINSRYREEDSQNTISHEISGRQ